MGGVALSANAFADGKIVIRPKIEVGILNNSNYWKAENNEVSVNTYSARPGLVFGYETAKSKIDLDATVDFFSYDDQDDPILGIREASEDDYVGYSALLTAETKPTDRLTLGIDDSIFKTRDVAQSDALSNSISRELYTINRITPNVYYDFGNKFAVRTKYRNTITNYDEIGEDSDENRGIVDLEYNLNRTSTIFLEYQIWNRDYDLISSDYMSNQATVNFAKQFNYFGILAGAGYHKRTFDDDTLDDLDMFSWSLVIQGQNPQAPEADPRSHIEFTLRQDMNDDGTGDQYYTATIAGLEAGYKFLPKLDTTLSVVYQNSDYQDDPEDRNDDSWTTTAKISYNIWDSFVLGLLGGFETRDSNIDGLSYDDTFVGLTLDYKFDFGGRK